jgi:putative hemolysin
MVNAVVKESFMTEVIFELRMFDEKEPGTRMSGRHCFRQGTDV